MRDVHRRTASRLFGVNEAEVTPEQRRLAKAIDFGVVYGMSTRRMEDVRRRFHMDSNLTDEERARIDAMSYDEMLGKWRFESSLTGYFTGERGKYFAQAMAKKRDADPAGAVKASKAHGW